MFKIYKMKIRPTSSYITPWHSDTIFGSLCWAMVQKFGESELKRFLSEYENDKYPFVISNGFIGDYLPKPMAGNVFPVQKGLSKSDAMDLAKKAKKAKKADLITIEEFNIIINDGQVEITDKPNLAHKANIMHNQVSRSNDTSEDGILYEHEEIFLKESYISLYMGIEDEWKDKILSLFQVLAMRGYGKRASVGKGHFNIEEFDEFDKFHIPENPNCFITLSNYVPKRNDPVKGQYKVFMKYGKLGQEYAHSHNPFKKPLMMINPGAVFWTDNPQLAYGRLVKNISNQYQNVVHAGCTLVVPGKIKEPEGI